jgi:alpha-tubulin suppressor-like RCC1 family protein
MLARRLGHNKTVSILPGKIGEEHGGYLDDRGQAWVWGRNLNNALGVNSAYTALPGSQTPMKVIGGFNFTKWVMGATNSLALDTAGHGWTWGYTASGQGGAQTTTTPTSPVSVVGGFSFSAISTGISNCIAINGANGMLYGWGANAQGELGNLTKNNSSSPVSVVGGMSFTDVKMGATFTVGLQGDGSVWCWGLGSSGQMGNGISSNSSPVSVSGGQSFKAISAGWGTGYAIRGSDGTMWSWGAAAEGRLGNNTTTNISSPVSVVGGISYTKVFGCTSGCFGLQANGTLWAWGVDRWANLGNGTSNAHKSSPVSVLGSGMASYVDVCTVGWDPDVGEDAYNFALDVNGRLWAWGQFRGGQTGMVDYFSTDALAAIFGWQTSPVVVMNTQQRMRYRNPNSFEGKTITLPKGTTHSDVRFFLTGDGQLWSWGGLKDRADLLALACRRYDGAGVSSNYIYGLAQPMQTLVTPYFKATDVTSGISHAAIITNTGTVWAWGANNVGQLGDGTATIRSSPVSVLGGHSFTQISSGTDYTLGLKADGSVWGWGLNTNGQLGDLSLTSKSSPVSLQGGLSFTKVLAGGTFAAGLQASGQVWCWGNGLTGRLGNNTTTTTSSPVSITGGYSFIDIAVGDHHTLGLTSTGLVCGWGLNSSFQLGDNAGTNRSSPLSVVGSQTRSYGEIFAGYLCSWALNGTAMYAWGHGASNELGQGATAAALTPIVLAGSYSWSKISNGGVSTIGLTTAGTLMACGSAIPHVGWYEPANSMRVVTTFFPF